MNAEIAERRRVRLERESQEESVRIEKELKIAEEEKRKKIEAANRIVESETEAIVNRIRAEDLERVIETALQNPVDHEFAIDLQGNIYRGRFTKSIEVPAKDREKIPLPKTVAEKILAGQKTF
jgi:small subunit ribosomal protein S26